MFLLTVILTLVSTSQAGCQTIPDTARIRFIGRFSDVRYTEEHSYGHAVELWRAGDCVFGLFEKAEGPAGDTPTGLLLDVRYTPDGTLGFIAKLTTGITAIAGSTAWVPSRDLFVFAGRLEIAALEGTLRKSDKLRPAVEPADTHIVLRRVSQRDGPLDGAKTYGAWREAIAPILRFRGPKW